MRKTKHMLGRCCPFVCLFLLPGFVSCLPASDRAKQPSIRDGVLNLRHWDFQRDGMVKLDGDWEFYWKEYVTPEKFSSRAPSGNWAALPGIWNGLPVSGGRAGGDGYATYRLVVKKAPKQELLALYLLDMNSAYRMYANGRLIRANGIAGTSPVNTRPAWRPGIAVFSAPGNVLELVLHVANFNHRKGGPEYTFRLGTPDDIKQFREYNLNFELFLFGSLLIMGLYNLGLFMLRRKDRSPFYFGLMCLMISVRTLTTGEKFLYEILEPVGWEALVKVEYLSYYLAVPLFTAFAGVVFAPRFHRLLLRATVWIPVLFSLVVLFTPVRWFSYTLPPYQIFTVIVCFYIFYVMLRSIPDNREAALVFLFGFLCLVITILNDMLHNNAVIRTAFIVPFGLFIFILFQAFLLSRRFARAMSAAEKFNTELEIQVHERTRDLRTANRRLKRIDAERIHFFTNISHEIRTPLTLLIAPLRSLLARGAGVDAQARATLLLMQRNAAALLRLINNLLDVSRLEANELSLNRIRTDVAQMAVAIKEQFEPAAQRAGIRLKAVMEGGDFTVAVDGDKLERVIYNLMANALDFTDEGEIVLTVIGAADGITVSVRDTGIGVSEEAREMIFERFFQAPLPSGRQLSQGSGLGLYLARKIVRMHGGELLLEATPDRGSIFTFNLPRSEGNVSHAASPAGEAGGESLRGTMAMGVPGEPRPGHESREFSGAGVNQGGARKESFTVSGARILIVDDSFEMRDYLLSLLRNHHEVETASDGKEAWEKLAWRRPDLIITDIMMPRMDGHSLFRLLRADSDLSGVPVIFLTAKATTRDRVEGWRAGIWEYMTKPFAPDEFLARVDNLLVRGKEEEMARRSIRGNIFDDLHDGIGARLTDLRLSLERLREGKRLEAGELGRLRDAIEAAGTELRRQIFRAEDLENLHANWIQGLHIILLRRYSGADRYLRFRAHESLEPCASLPNNIVHELLALFEEIATNDLKYGEATSNWDIIPHEDGNILVRIRTASGREPLPGGLGMGRGESSMKRRIRRLEGTMAIEAREKHYELRIVLPKDKFLVSQLRLERTPG